MKKNFGSFGFVAKSSARGSGLGMAATAFLVALALAALAGCATVKPEAGQGDPLSYDWVMEHGDQFQQGELCVRYFRGDLGVESDYVKAYALCYKSAQECVSDAAVTLSWMYANGLGVKADLKAALGWNYLIVADQEEGMLVLEDRRKLEASLTEAERAEALKFACEWQEKYCGGAVIEGCDQVLEEK